MKAKESKKIKKLTPLELEEEHLFLDSVVENIPNMIFVKDAKDLRFVRFNKAGEDLLGFKREELIGKNDYDFFPKEQADFFISRDRAVLNHKVLVDIPEEQIDTKLKGRRTLHTKKIPILGPDGEPLYLLGISEDITDSKKVMEEVRMIEELHEVDKLKSEFVTVAAHQLRTPLSGMKWTLAMMIDGENGSLTKKQKALLTEAAESNNRLIKLVNDLLNADRLNQGKFKLALAPINLQDTMDNLMTEFSPLADRNGVALTLTLNVKSPVVVMGEAIGLRSIFQNIIENAIKYTGKGGEVHITLEQKLFEVLVDISDNGIGISDEEKEKIFSRFFRGSNAIKVETDGTGLGLYIAKTMVERHGGKIWFESVLGKGSTFHIILPVTGKGKK